MKKLFYLFLSFTLFISGVRAQDCSDVTASATVTPSTCQSNGSITITFLGASADSLVSKQYSIKSTTGTISIGPVSTNVFNDLPPGNYNLEAAGFCKSLMGESIVRTINNVVIAGSYEEPRLSFVAQSISTNTAAVPTSRKSYVNCSTGLIVVLLENGNQTDMPTFTITSVSAGDTIPQTVNATKATSGSAAAGWRYLLDGTWPAGTYTVSANDGCYTAAATFIIDEITTVPPGSISTSYYRTNLYPYGDGTDCSKAYYLPYYYYDSTTYPDWYRYYADGLYEYGIAPTSTGEMPKAENWFPVRNFSGSTSTTYRDLFDLSPGKVSDYYTSGSLTVYTRVKNCPSAITSYRHYNRNNATMTDNTVTCTGIRTYSFYYAKSSYPQYHTYCYPLTITVTDRLTGDTISTNSNYLFTDPNLSWICNPGESQYLNIEDASGYKILTNYAMSGGTPASSLPTIYNYGPESSSSYSSYANCDSYKRTYYTNSGTPCEDEWAYPCYVTITDGDGTIIKLDTLTSTTTKTIDNLQYGVAYKFTYVYPNWNNLTLTVNYSSLARSTYVPSAFTLSKYEISQCKDNTGRLQVSTGNYYKSFKPGTTITITGPAGYAGQSYTYTSNTTSYNNYFTETYLPPGVYTAAIVSCGETYTSSLTVGGYTGDRLDYTTEQDCMGLKLFPSGSISNNGVPLSTVYFRMTKVPSGSDANTKVIASTSSDSFLLGTPGTYILGMMTSNSLTDCAIKLDTIVYNPLPLALDKDKTSAYSCPDGDTGYLTLQATNGVLPYTYSVYDKTNTTLLYGPETSYSEIDLGNFGIANETYTVRMSDACGNSFDQQVTLVSLDRTALAYGQSPVCYGEPISIHGFTVTNATYTWTGPNGFTSTAKNPIIPNAASVNEGWYKVKIASLTCNITVIDSIYIAVYDPISVADINGKTQEVTLCPYQALIIGQAATGGSGDFTYQWAYNTSTAGTGTWTNLAGETNPTFKATTTTYMFTSTTASPSRRYLRLAITAGSCGTYYLIYHTNVRACMFLVNPDLKSPGSTGN